MKPNNYSMKVRLCFVGSVLLSGLAGALSVSATIDLFFERPWWLHMALCLLFAVYGIECARQSLLYARKWPQWSIAILSVLSFSFLVQPPNYLVGFVAFGLSLLLWFGAYKCIVRLLAR